MSTVMHDMKSAPKHARRRDKYIVSARSWRARDPQMHRESVRILVLASRAANRSVVWYLKQAREFSEQPERVRPAADLQVLEAAS